MIDFLDSPRGSGKTRTIAKLFRKNPGLVFSPYISEIPKGTPHHRRYHYNDFEKAIYYEKPRNIYMDDFFNQHHVNLLQIIELDKMDNGYNIIIRGTSVHTPLYYTVFVKYMQEHYPESLI